MVHRVECWSLGFGGFHLPGRIAILGSFFAESWQADEEHRATIRIVAASDLAVVVVDDAVAGGESKAGALADRLRGVKRVEDTLRFAQPGSVVGHFDLDRVLFAA